MPSFYRAKSSHSRPNVPSRLQNSLTGISHAKGEYEMTLNFYNEVDEEELKLMPELVQKMLKNNTCVVRKCAKCSWVCIIPRKTFNKVGRAIIAIHGEYWCKPCHQGIKRTVGPEAKKRQEIYRRAYEHSGHRKMMANAFQGRTYSRKMTPEERKQYGLD